MKHYSVYNYFHPQHLAAKVEARNRSGGLCQLCGQPGEVAHHWRQPLYKDEVDTTGDELTWLCYRCDHFATTVRRVESYGGDPLKHVQAIDKATKETLWSTESMSTEHRLSSCTTSFLPLMTPFQKSKNGTESTTSERKSKQTTPDSPNSMRTFLSGSRTKEPSEYLKERYGL